MRSVHPQGDTAVSLQLSPSLVDKHTVDDSGSHGKETVWEENDEMEHGGAP
jgi:hypothetical protein